MKRTILGTLWRYFLAAERDQRFLLSVAPGA